MASTHRRSAREPRRAGRRPPIRKRRGTPPYVLVLMVVLPLVALGVALAVKGPREEPAPPPSPQYDPNKEIIELGKRFQMLKDKQRETMGLDRESTKFQTRVESLKSSWSRWMDDYTKIFKGVRNLDGSWPEEFHEYSALKARAGLMKVDLIRAGNL